MGATKPAPSGQDMSECDERPTLVAADAPDAREPVPPPDPLRARGPLLAVCGLCGGAGATTFAYLVALSAARSRRGPVLVCDDGGPSSALACYAGVEAPHSLREVADMLAAGLPTDRVYVSGRDGLRVLATGPRLGAGRSRAGVQLLLDQAREAHALTVVDCGTLARNAERLALANASHVAWVLPATAGAVQRARRVLEAVADRPLGRQLLVARPDPHQRKPPLAELKRLAEARHAALILLPALPDLGSGGGDDALAVAQVPLQAVHGLLAR